MAAHLVCPWVESACLQMVCGACAVPEGTRFHFPPYPALRLRLRAGL